MKTTAFIAALTALTSLQVQAADLRIATGSEGNPYNLACSIGILGNLQAVTGQCDATAGSVDNLNRIAAGNADAAIVQGDVLPFFLKNFQPVKVDFVGVIHQDVSHLLCSLFADVDELSDLYGMENAKVLIGAYGSGHQVQWETLEAKDDDMAAIPTEEKGRDEALALVRDGHATCLFFVGKPGAKSILDILEFGNGQIVLADFRPEDYDDVIDPETKKQLYTKATIDGDLYKGLAPGALWGSRDVSTLSVPAKVYISSAKAKELPVAKGQLARAVTRASKN